MSDEIFFPFPEDDSAELPVRQSPEPLHSDFFVTILGSGAALPTFNRHCSAQVVSVRGFKLLIDCGEGTQGQMRACHQRLQSFSLICISHLHGDHFFGLPGLLETMHLCGRTEPITIIGPKGIREVLKTIIRFSGCMLRYEVSFRELTDDECGTGCVPVFSNDHCVVSAFSLRHSIATFGFIVEEIPRSERPHRRYAYCSDTGYFDELADIVRGVELLCLESTFADDFASVAVEKQHCTASQAATLARKANVGRLLLTHFSNRYKDISVLLNEARSVFPETLAAADRERFGIEYRGKYQKSMEQYDAAIGKLPSET
ncbi:MAG: ribonuclease Z [Bacteroidales bacterium]|nr:ribonuclease Z [Bacteroidales bacterium]